MLGRVSALSPWTMDLSTYLGIGVSGLDGSWYDGSWADGRCDGFGTEESERERYAGEWVKDVRAGTGVLTDAHGKAWDV